MSEGFPQASPRFSHREVQRHLAAQTLSREAASTVEFVQGQALSQPEFSAMLNHLRRGEPALVPLADGLMASLGYTRGHPFRVAAVELASKALDDTEEKAAYHNHLHATDVVCSFYRLATTEAEGLSREDVAVGLLAAIGHDKGYNPTDPAAGGAHERESVRQVESILGNHVTKEHSRRIDDMIAGTELGKSADVRRAYLALGAPESDTPEQRTARMTALLVRSDLAVSTSTTEALNWEMSQRLKRETGVDRIADLEARRDFVAAHAPYTAAERERGFDVANTRLVAQLDRELAIQRREGPEQGAAELPQYGAVEPVRMTEELRQKKRVSLALEPTQI